MYTYTYKHIYIRIYTYIYYVYIRIYTHKECSVTCLESVQRSGVQHAERLAPLGSLESPRVHHGNNLPEGLRGR